MILIYSTKFLNQTGTTMVPLRGDQDASGNRENGWLKPKKNVLIS